MNAKEFDVGDMFAVVVMYKKLLEDSDTLITLDKSCYKVSRRLNVLVYDNSPSSAIQSSPVALYSNLQIEYVHDPTNPGLSRAYNYGLQRALDLGRKWLLIMDHDSQVEMAFISKTIVSINKCAEICLHLPIVFSGRKVISPSKLFLGRNLGFKYCKQGVNVLHSFFAINSGMLINVEYLKSIGGYNERYALYFTDNWFCYTYSKNNKMVNITGATILHDLAMDTCQAPDRRMWIYAQNVKMSRALYAYSPLALLVLIVMGLFGALKRALLYKDIGYLRIFIGRYK